MAVTIKKHDLVDIDDWTVKRETEKGILLKQGNKEVWVPKQFVEVNDDGTLTVPEWLAIGKGLI